MRSRADVWLVVSAFVLSAMAVWVLTDTLIPDSGTPRAVVKEVEDLVRGYGVIQPTDEELALAAASGMAANLDPWSAAMSRESVSADRMRYTGHYAGVGVVLEEIDAALTILHVIKNSPAERAGLQELERIVAVDGWAVPRERAVEQARGRLRGEEGSLVRLRMANAAQEEREVEIRRAEVPEASVFGAMLDDAPGVGVLVLERFHEQTAAEAETLLKALSAEGLKALVLDLRDNPGGLLNSPAHVAGYFLGDHKLVVRTAGARTHGELRVGASAPWAELPLVVLVDGRTASSAEVLSAALQDYARAPLVGERTFGKGVVQQSLNLESMPGAALRLTVAHYFAPSGRCIERSVGLAPGAAGRGGLIPDLTLELSSDERVSADHLRDRWRYSPAVRAHLGARQRFSDPQLNAAVALLQGHAPADRRLH
jgi:carboxyl-terminal processing protease